MSETQISIEFFPPRDDAGRDRLVTNVAGKLAKLKPDFFSVTYGAGGSTRDGTLQTVRALIEAGHHAVPHLSLGGSSLAEIHALLDDYASLGVDTIVALRGDQPSGMGPSRFELNAEALIQVIRDHRPDDFKLIVAAYPEVHPDATSAASDLDFFERKVKAGADIAITQYFFNADAYAYFRDNCSRRGIDIPIIPGIMPITNYQALLRFSEQCGAQIPRWLDYAMRAHQDDDSALAALGVEVVSRLCERLRSLGAPAFHFYTLNRWGATTRICENLNPR